MSRERKHNDSWTSGTSKTVHEAQACCDQSAQCFRIRVLQLQRIPHCGTHGTCRPRVRHPLYLPGTPTQLLSCPSLLLVILRVGILILKHRKPETCCKLMTINSEKCTGLFWNSLLTNCWRGTQPVSILVMIVLQPRDPCDHIVANSRKVRTQHLIIVVRSWNIVANSNYASVKLGKTSDSHRVYREKIVFTSGRKYCTRS